MAALDMEVLPYIRRDRVCLAHQWADAPTSQEGAASHVHLRVESQHGADCPMPMAAAVEWRIEVRLV